MRIVREAASLAESYQRARSEAKAAFGSDEVYLEKLLEGPKHIEVQILGDRFGNIIHLYERDCSVQRRHQKLVEAAPAVALPAGLREDICAAAVKLMKNVGYVNAGTVEFLVTPDNKFYFIEVNPRIQVEHTITEMVTGIDIVQAQLLVADGYPLTSPEIDLPSQEAVRCYGHAIQCRITTEDPASDFMPDTGKIITYRSGGGFGLRLDAGNAYSGSVITPFYDSLLVKASTWGRTHEAAIAKMKRCLEEFRVRGVKTNIPFLRNVVSHEQFLHGTYDTSFVDAAPELFILPTPKDRATKLMKYIGNITVNGYESLGRREKPAFPVPRMPAAVPGGEIPAGSRQILEARGVDGLMAWIREQDRVLLTDTTLRDAHQSLLATRVRSRDMLAVIDATVRLLPGLFSLEMWGGATFDVAYRFLHEDPWERLAALRERTPNILFQMLLRSANAVGYTNYPDNVVRHFVAQAAAAGIDVFRVFDSLNWLEGMRVAIDAVRETGKVVEASLCYTGDILDPRRSKYDLNYYVTMARELEKAGTRHPRHQGHGRRAETGSGLPPGGGDQGGGRVPRPPAQPRYERQRHLYVRPGDRRGGGHRGCGHLVPGGHDVRAQRQQPLLRPGRPRPAAGRGHPRPERAVPLLGGCTQLLHRLRYEDVLPQPGGLRARDAGGTVQQPQAAGQGARPGAALGRGQEDVPPGERYVRRYREGDAVLQGGGRHGAVHGREQPVGRRCVRPGRAAELSAVGGRVLRGPDRAAVYGFPEKLQALVLKGKKPLTCRPGELLPPADFAAIREAIGEIPHRETTDKDLSAYALYPKVFADWVEFVREYGDVSILDTPTFFYGMLPGEEIRADIEQGKTLFIKLLAVGTPDADGVRVVGFELNGLLREIAVRDASVKTVAARRRKADVNNPEQVAAAMSGTVVKVLVAQGARVRKGTPLLATEAMKMETSIQAAIHGFVKEILVQPGDRIETGDLLMTLSRHEVSLADQEEQKR